jgi:hypothetical protein
MIKPVASRRSRLRLSLDAVLLKMGLGDVKTAAAAKHWVV